MNSDEQGGFIGLLLVFVLPMIVGLILVTQARSLARAKLRLLVRNWSEQLEPSRFAIMTYRVAGAFFIVAPLVLLLTVVLASLHHY